MNRRDKTDEWDFKNPSGKVRAEAMSESDDKPNAEMQQAIDETNAAINACFDKPPASPAAPDKYAELMDTLLMLAKREHSEVCREYLGTAATAIRALRSRVEAAEALAKRSVERLAEMAQPGFIGAFAARDAAEARITHLLHEISLRNGVVDDARSRADQAYLARKAAEARVAELTAERRVDEHAVEEQQFNIRLLKNSNNEMFAKLKAAEARVAELTEERDGWKADSALANDTGKILFGAADSLRERLQAAEAQRDAALRALEQSIIAIDDWLHIHASDHCDEEHVAKSYWRIGQAGGTLAYIADVQQQNRAALAAKEPGNDI